MRIIAGALKGRVLAPVQGRTRPTAARVREAIFNILGAAVAEARVLDLFAGTGALGIEALSRGAAAAVFVEDHPEALKGLRRNLETLGLVERSQVLPLPVAAALRKLAARGEPFDLVFLDPPYGGDVAAGHPGSPGRVATAPAPGLGGGGAQPPGDPAGDGGGAGATEPCGVMATPRWPSMLGRETEDGGRELKSNSPGLRFCGQIFKWNLFIVLIINL